jgi:hypothetical protein
VVLLLGGVIITLVVRAVEGQSARDPVSQPAPPLVASGDTTTTHSLDGTQVAMALRRRGGSESPIVEASYVTLVPEESKEYAEIDAARVPRGRVHYPDSADRTDDAKMVRDWLTKPRKWGRVTLPGDVRKALGDAEVYLMSGGGGHEEMWGALRGQYYLLPVELNQLAVDAGFIPSRSNLEQLMRVYGFFVIASDRMFRFHADFDSALNGEIPLVRPFRLGMLGARLATDKGPHYEMEMPKYTAGIARAVMDWGNSQDTVTLTFAGSVGIEGAVFPYEWTTGHDGRIGFWKHDFQMPSPPPEKRGELEDIEFEVDLARSSDAVRQFIR